MSLGLLDNQSHCSLSSAFSVHCLIFFALKSATTSSIRLKRGLPFLLPINSLPSIILLGIAPASILFTWPSHLILCAFVNFTISSVKVKSWINYTSLEYATLIHNLLVILSFRSFNDDTSASDVAQCRMKYGEVKIWKKVFVSLSEYCLGTFLERMEFKAGAVIKKLRELLLHQNGVTRPRQTISLCNWHWSAYLPARDPSAERDERTSPTWSRPAPERPPAIRGCTTPVPVLVG